MPNDVTYPAQFTELFSDELHNNDYGYSVGFAVAFRDIPNIAAIGTNYAEAIEAAQVSLKDYIQRTDNIIEPSRAQLGDVIIAVEKE